MSVYKSARALATGIIIALSASYAQAQQAACTVYEDAFYRGSSLQLEDGRTYMQLNNWNNRISSIRVREGCQLRIGEEFMFFGRRENVQSDVTHVGDWNDRISAIACSCDKRINRRSEREGARAACRVYEHANYGGAVLELENGRTYSRLNKWNDKISSIQVDNGCTLKVGVNANFRGADEEVTRNISYVGQNWNDQISALSCSCDGRSNRGNGSIGGRTQNNEPRVQRSRNLEPLSRSGDACRLYGRPNYAGRAISLRAGQVLNDLGDRFDRRASSLQVANGCAVVIDFGAKYKLWFETDLAEFWDRIDDRTVGAACYCPRGR
ncbi:MAG: hypothetical protein MRY63_14225 [Neomegalonema sp.]|nr:hypothetical protein [Neomegalonema sp.]